MSVHTIPERSSVRAENCWDLSSLFKTDADWEQSIKEISGLAQQIAKLRGRIGFSATDMLDALRLNEQMEQLIEKTGNYAFLLSAQDAGNTAAQDKVGRYMMAASQAEAQISFFVPEIQSISEDELKKRIDSENYRPYRVFLQKLLRLKPYILSEKEERLFALQSESMQTPSKTFSMLVNVDIDYGIIKTPEGDLPLSQASWPLFMLNKDRDLRKSAYDQFYKAFDTHKNTICSLYAGSVNQDIYLAKARGYASAREMALFPDRVPLSVYDNLVSVIRENLKPLHKYYSLLKKTLGLKDLRHYDVYMPLTKDIQFVTPYEKAVEILREALAPLGTEYTDTLCAGLTGGWVDRYENKGKKSGAFSSGGYSGYPYILMNYKEKVIRDLFTLAHEGGHSMHSWYSARSNPFMQYGCTIFEAEVASTFNEQLLFEYLLKNTTDTQERIYLLSTRLSDILATLYRQTMFAEYELKTHQLVETGQPLSVEVCRSVYRELLQAYFGPEMVFEKESDLECLRIPHFYNAFYVYKYATGISASLALAKKVTSGGLAERNDYFAFLKSGGSRYPIESLKLAGVNMENMDPIKAAVEVFSDLIAQIEQNIQ